MADSTSSRPAIRPALAGAARFWREDVAAKGVGGTLQTVARMLRLAMRWPAHRAWCRIVGGPTTRGILAVYPRIVYLPSFSYLFQGTTWKQRLAMTSAHYAFLNRWHDRAFFDRTLSPGGLPLWRAARDGRSLSIALLGPCLASRHHEGDLTLAFALDGAVLCKLAFSLIGSAALPDLGGPARSVIYIGQVQGAPESREVFADATHLMGAVTPRDLLMSALAGAAQAWGVDTLVGVAGERLLSSGAWLNSSSRFDYARFWQQFGGRAGAQGHFAIALPFHEKPLGEIAARHRGRTLAKRRFKQAVAAEMAAALRVHLKP